MKITTENLYPCFNAGTPNNKQLAMFGMSWPLRNGWANEMIGREVSDDFLVKLAFLRKQRDRKQVIQIQAKTRLLLSHDDSVLIHPQPNGEFILTYAQNIPITHEGLDRLSRAIKFTRKHTLA
jgi:hypothetical protein